MKKIVCCMFFIAFVSACSNTAKYQEPEYNYIAEHVRVIEKASSHVVYEYTNIRVDEVAPVAAIYCNDHGRRQASLYNITTWKNNRRRATFVCK